MTTLHEKLKSARLALGLSQDEFAEQLGVTAQSVMAWEKGDSIPRITRLRKVAEMSGKPVSYFSAESNNAGNELVKLYHLLQFFSEN